MPDSIKDKVHVIRFGPDLSKESDGLIHHMLIYTCDPKDGDIPMYSGPSNSLDVPDKVSRCNRLVGGWAMGMEATSYPKVAGLPLGGNDKSRYFRLQVHYNNPTMRSGVQDSSGIRFYYINNLRKYDIGILEIGLSMDAKMAIPPRQKELVLSGTCPKQCTSEGVPTEGINVIASHLHTHLAGRKVWISHFRDGVQLPDVNRDDHYSTFFEETRQIYPSVKIMPGDSLKTHCAYETLNREEVTVTGLAITDEMCISYLHYYPAATLELCDSTISRNALSEFIVLENLLKGRPKEVDFHDFIENYKNMQWDNGTIDELKYLYKTARLDVECRRSSGSLFEGNFNDVDVS